MKKTKQKINRKKLIWIPRSLIIAYILFISLFSFDTQFGIGFFIHLLPPIIFLLILIFTWKKPKLAAISFALVGVMTIFFWNTYRELFVFLIISLIPILTGILFWIFKGKK